VSTADVRIPATITGIASGSSTRRSCSDGVIPTPCAASITAGSIEESPATVFLSTGSRL
jgi:hypothetical protein